ncbi:hypothetical protein IC762_19645 [Bradyrhizobium genosp. L]|uniref:hypothetical protein n=1 Tax=Bradyrhizobium genosp. L TaxID=83637 RepID=UPI0018A2AC7F|nr:hypothetical protein [Bradyrhizobium genosp. L]QPF82009.1 hypothetical protein IC762_19645 [Bradyrhizobium genosp. L]
MAIRTWSLIVCLLVCTAPQAFAGSMNKHDPWDPRHISGLPPEVQSYIAGICKSAPAAQHDFATYNPHERRWRINLEYLRCDGLGEFRRGNQCVDVDFVAVGAQYRLASRHYADCGY